MQIALKGLKVCLRSSTLNLLNCMGKHLVGLMFIMLAFTCQLLLENLVQYGDGAVLPSKMPTQ